MALETPNAIVAAAVLLYDPAAATKFELRSSNGILTLENFAFTGPTPGAVMQLETPVTADEGCIVQQGITLGVAMTPTEAVLLSLLKDGPIGDPGYDALPDDTLVALAASPTAKARFSIAVLKLPRPLD
jgi:hypothetical protein